MSCTSCHAAVPKLNSFGEHFAANGYRLPNWKDKRESYGDDRLNLPDTIPWRYACRVLRSCVPQTAPAK